ncbi:MAG: hypothetical protein AB8H86_29740 [Polyangiales bacterium]
MTQPQKPILEILQGHRSLTSAKQTVLQHARLFRITRNETEACDLEMTLTDPENAGIDTSQVRAVFGNPEDATDSREQWEVYWDDIGFHIQRSQGAEDLGTLADDQNTLTIPLRLDSGEELHGFIYHESAARTSQRPILHFRLL